MNVCHRRVYCFFFILVFKSSYEILIKDPSVRHSRLTDEFCTRSNTEMYLMGIQLHVTVSQIVQESYQLSDVIISYRLL